MLNNNSRLARAINIIHEGVTKKNYDNVLCIVGDEGKGKSNILLNIVDYWLRKIYDEVNPEMANKYIAMDSKDLGKVLKDVTNYDILANDEAADLSNRSSMSKMNKTYVKAYQIIRGKNLFTILVLPDLFDLDSFFRKRRVRHLIYTDKRGIIAFWGKKRLKKLVALNEDSKIKSYTCVRPLFIDRVPLYKGILAEPYKIMKENKISLVQQQLYDELTNETTDKGSDRLGEAMIKLKEEYGLSNAQVGKFFSYTGQTVGNYIRRISDDHENENIVYKSGEGSEKV